MRRYLNRRKLVYILTALLLGAVLLPAARSVVPQAYASPPPGVEPQTVNATLSEGKSTTVAKTVHTPAIPPKPDILFLSDTTGSMGPAIANVRTNAVAIMNAVLAAQPDAQFGAAEYKDADNCGDPFAYHLDQAITANTVAVQNGINLWSASGGCDTPEQQLNALYTLATDPATGFRPGSTRIVAWFGDSSGHDPSFGHTLANAIAALQAAGIKVIAVPVSGSGDGLDSTGQATAIATATGGSVRPSAAPDDVANAILSGLQNLPVTVSPQLGACDPNLAVTFDALGKTATSGDNVNFTETIAVAPGAPFGTTLLCHVDFLLNGNPAGPEFGEDISITVPKHAATLTSTTSLQLFAQGYSATLSAVLTDPDGGAPISGKPVVLTLGSGSSAQSCTGTTDATGTASCSINPVTVPLGPQPVTDSFAGDASYKAASDNIQRALVFAFLKQGAFVLGDTTTANALASSPASTVNWWGAQWAKNNVLSGGAAPDAMKGFAGSPSSAPPACGGTYTTGPGNSTPPPAASSIPSYMGVIVSRQVTKSGSTISGDILHIVVVNTDPGYQPNPGHPGTGTVVAAVC